MYKSAQVVCGNSDTGHGSPDPSWEAETGETDRDCDASKTLSQKNNRTKQRENKEGRRKSPTLLRNSKFSTSAGHGHKSLGLFYSLTHYQSSIYQKKERILRDKELISPTRLDSTFSKNHHHFLNPFPDSQYLHQQSLSLSISFSTSPTVLDCVSVYTRAPPRFQGHVEGTISGLIFILIL